MTTPDPAKVDEYMRTAEKQLRNTDFHRGDAPARAAVARVWLDMARLQHDRVRDYAALTKESPTDG
ncbi:hypothetical protein Q8791_22950 [Nocardiopsis sp. CT-R113]|uniref:Uncharacterized protein n=1 Tax=Nocardiopsis codii TaxID=3065942 RepID=A0ABU7KDT9_9ACTN|nr:hypothetical protein [Nocardiopsis sp. CT-R113]MEE2040079.1 hypothetical protein [Nocardiopsis sp. CT-R113]